MQAPRHRSFLTPCDRISTQHRWAWKINAKPAQPEEPVWIDALLSCRREEMTHADPTGGGMTHVLACE
ncbi:hypothetical protein NDU88_004736 [Pleurodeles waltl]|uniref:Uncharacterized protein n=1 Tax=Pleurodeles waltl TaxID=8319 RepID=A0AAV7V3S8_PLEWA|nr:hypothetical protein NDU88_004736 [Pleurodeles waltl]